MPIFSYFTKLGVDFHILQNMNLSGTISIVLLQNIDIDQLNLLFFLIQAPKKIIKTKYGMSLFII